MQYKIWIVQDGGYRPYCVAPFEFEGLAESPIAPQQLEGSYLTKALCDTISRISGYEFMNSFIKPGDVGVEVGVDHGDGAARLLENDIARLILVDPWTPTSDRDGWTDVELEEMDRRHLLVSDRFSDDPRVSIHRESSHDFLPTLPGGSIDWIYLDGSHYEEDVYKDLSNSLRIVRPGGYIFGDDLNCRRWSIHIAKAVQRFLDDNSGRVELVWYKSDPFVLRVLDG